MEEEDDGPGAGSSSSSESMVMTSSAISRFVNSCVLRKSNFKFIGLCALLYISFYLFADSDCCINILHRSSQGRMEAVSAGWSSKD